MSREKDKINKKGREGIEQENQQFDTKSVARDIVGHFIIFVRDVFSLRALS